MASGWNVWVWLVGVVRMYIDFLIILLIPIYLTCISFFCSNIPTSLLINF